jgi:hypothetical protein
MTVATSQLGTALCYVSAIHLLFILWCSVQNYFNNGLRFVWENASQPREQTSLFRRSRHLFIRTSVPKSYGMSSRSVQTQASKNACKNNLYVRRQAKWTRTLKRVQVLTCQKNVLFIHCDCEILACSNCHIVPVYNDT